MARRIAIIGYSFRFPGCGPDEFWPALLEGRDLVTEVAPDRWAHDAFSHPDRRHPGTAYTHAAGSLGEVAGFDAGFFGISPREAGHMDPQQRLLLELTWEAMERAGVVPSRLRGSNCGVYMGVTGLDYAFRYADDPAAVDAFTATGSAASIAANRISYLFDLHGPSMALDTACSSSLVALHQACQAIRAGETDTALAGGVSMHLHPFGFLGFSKAGMLSPTGRCHVFDEQGDGYVRSEGAGVVLLKDYDQALADGDRVLAVIAASGVNTDGSKSGLTVPNGQAQAQLIRDVYRRAELDPDALDYLEAHGTGTAVGDPIETRAIAEALARSRKHPLPIGSVKSNLGHLEMASGMAGLIKAVHTLEHRVVPATISLQRANPRIPFDDWNLSVVTRTMPLKAQGTLRVGVNSFGFGGANAHVVLETPPATVHRPRAELAARPASAPADTPLRLSAQTPAALTANAAALAAHLGEHEHTLTDVASTLFHHREHHRLGAVVMAADRAAAAEALEGFARSGRADPAAGLFTGERVSDGASGPVFVYSGNGCQWAAMGQTLMAESARFRAVLADVDQRFRRWGDFSLTALLEHPPEQDWTALTELAQPALFALQVGLTECLADLGVRPSAVVGHSVGEVAAAWASGALSLDDAVKVIHYRSYHQGQTAGTGGMTAVSLSEEALRARIEATGRRDIALAGVNSSRGTVVAGPTEALAVLEAALHEAGVRHRRLALDYGFHSPLMDPIGAAVQEDLAGLRSRSPRVPFYSTVTGGRITEAALDAAYWWRNIREPVRFADAAQALLDAGQNVFVEIGAHPILRGYLREALRARQASGVVVETLRRGDDSATRITGAFAGVLLSGAAFDHARWFGAPGRWVALPTYAWDRDTYWLPQTRESVGLLDRYPDHPLLGHRLARHEGLWEHELDTQRQPWLAEHVVGDGAVFPAAGFVELALAAAERTVQQPVLDIEEAEILAPLLLGDDQWTRTRFEHQSASGRFTLKARPLIGEGDWKAHLRGRITPQSAGTLLAQTPPALPDRAPDFDRDSHLADARRIGLDYGPAFQCISRGWVTADAVIGVFDPPEAVRATAEQYVLHPGLLDSALQLFVQLLRDELSIRPGVAFLPTQVGRLQFDHLHAGSLPATAHVRLRRRSPHSLLADIALFTEEGTAMAVLQGVRFRAAPLRRHSDHRPDWLDWQLVAAPLKAGPLAGVPLPEDSVQRLVRAYRAAPGWTAYAEEIEPLLDSLVESFVRDAFSGVDGAHWQACLARDARVAVLAERAQQAGWLHNSADETPVCEPPEVAPALIWNTLLGEHPDYFELVRLVGQFGMSLRHCVRGDGEEAPVRLESGRIGQVLRSLGGQSAPRALAVALADELRRCQALLGPGQRLSVLELGASRPALGELMLPRLDLETLDYAFASTESAALTEAELALEGAPLARCVALDPGTGAAQEAVVPAHWAVVHLDFASPAQAERVLAALPGWLAPGARVLLVGHHPAWWLDWVLDWADDGKATLQRQAEHWQERLTALGYEAVSAEDLQAPGLGQVLFSARAPAGRVPELAHRHWQLVADADTEALADQLARVLREAGQSVHVDSVERWASGTEADADGAPRESAPVECVWLASAGATDALGESLGCERLARWAAGAEAAGHVSRCWVITRGVGSVYAGQADERWGRMEAAPPAGAVTWGFVRTLMNEASGLGWRLLDLPAGGLSQVPLTAWAETLLHADDEDELFLSAEGARWAPRLRLAAPRTVSARLGEPGPVSLSFPLPGQLRNLQWTPLETTRLAPGPGEVRVRVAATGLNFRDVMYALGLLSDEAIENGFSGPTLGLEFAGEVVATGEGVTELAVGDDVLGFGAASFSTELCAPVTAVTRMPAGLSHEAAATIPTVFFTVYYALQHLAQLQPGERVLIHGAAGGVGLAAIQVAQALGAEVFATAGSPEKRNLLRLMGVRWLFDSRSHTFAEQILAATPDGQGVDVVLNSLSGEALTQNLRVLNPLGRFLELGKRDFYENTAIGLRPFRNNISYFGIDSDQLLALSPRLTHRLFAQMMALFESGDLHPLPYTRFEADQVVEAFRFMQQARQIGKVVVGYTNPPRPSRRALAPAQPAPLALSASGAWLVTGGLRGFGLRTAQWLVAQGARRVALVSRSGQVTDEAQSAIDAMQAQGAQVVIEACDITDRAAVQSLCERLRDAIGPLKGVVHAATVIEDGLARNLNAEQIERVLAPKIKGAWHLHEFAGDVDYFVLYSSATTLFGNPGQGNYIAANHWLEALARYRNRQGQPASCIRWAAIDDVGFLARNEQVKKALQSRMGGDALPSSVALAALGELLREGDSVKGVMVLDWQAIRRFLPTAESPRYREIAALFQSYDAGGGEEAGDVRAMLEELGPDAFHARVVEMLKAELSSILMIPEVRIEAHQPVQEMGFDSLMGVELMSAIESRFGVQLPVMAVSEAATLATLATRITQALEKGRDEESGARAAEAQIVEAMAERHGVVLEEKGE